MKQPMKSFLSHYDFRDTSTGEENSELALKIQDCRYRRGVEVCSACPFFDECSLVKEYLRLKAGYSGSPTGGGSAP